MSPPPTAPVAKTRPPCFTTTLAPVTLIVPPARFAELASNVPPTVAVPLLPPKSSITPPRLMTPCASMTPVLFTTVCKIAFFDLALRMTVPSSARIAPPFLTAVSNADLLTWNCSNWFPLSDKSTEPPAPKAVMPPGVSIIPSLVTVFPINATYPPEAATTLPSFKIEFRLSPLK